MFAFYSSIRGKATETVEKKSLQARHFSLESLFVPLMAYMLQGKPLAMIFPHHHTYSERNSRPDSHDPLRARGVQREFLTLLTPLHPIVYVAAFFCLSAVRYMIKLSCEVYCLHLLLCIWQNLSSKVTCIFTVLAFPGNQTHALGVMITTL